MYTLFHLVAQLCIGLFSSLEQAFLHLTQPSRHSIVLSTAADLTRSKADLIAENALLRQQLIVLHRQINKPAFSQSDRLWLGLLAARVKNWKEALLILKPNTLLRWRRQGFRLFWKFKSRNRGGRSQALHGDRRSDPADGTGESPVRARTHSRRTAQLGLPVANAITK